MAGNNYLGEVLKAASDQLNTFTEELEQLKGQLAVDMQKFKDTPYTHEDYNTILFDYAHKHGRYCQLQSQITQHGFLMSDLRIAKTMQDYFENQNQVPHLEITEGAIA